MVNFSKKYQSLELISNDKSKLIYTATNTETNEKVILKLFNEYDYKKSQFDELKRFVEFSNLNKNSNLLKIHNIDNDIYHDTRYYIVEMECIEGKSLKSLLENKSFNEKEALWIIRQLINGLNELHRLNIVYKNLSTEKIFLNEEGKLKLDSTGYIDKDNENIKYISPEQAINEPINKISDIYSLGIILYEMINKELPFVWENGKEELYKSMTKDFYISKDKCSENIVSILENCLYIDPLERYENLDVFLLDIISYLDYNIRIFRYNRENERLLNKENIKINENNIDKVFTLDNEIKSDEEAKFNEEVKQDNEIKEDNKHKKHEYIRVISICATVALVTGGLIFKGSEVIDNLKSKNDSSNINTSNENNTTKDNDEIDSKENQEDNIDSTPKNETNIDTDNNEYKKTNKENTSIDIDEDDSDNNQAENDIIISKPNQNTDDTVNTKPQKPQIKPEQTPNNTPQEKPEIPETPDQMPDQSPDDTPGIPEQTPETPDQSPDQMPDQMPDQSPDTPDQSPDQTPDNKPEIPDQTPQENY